MKYYTTDYVPFIENYYSNVLSYAERDIMVNCLISKDFYIFGKVYCHSKTNIQKIIHDLTVVRGYDIEIIASNDIDGCVLLFKSKEDFTIFQLTTGDPSVPEADAELVYVLKADMPRAIRYKEHKGYRENKDRHDYMLL